MSGRAINAHGRVLWIGEPILTPVAFRRMDQWRLSDMDGKFKGSKRAQAVAKKFAMLSQFSMVYFLTFERMHLDCALRGVL
jgi:hypothetical protein